MFKKTSKYAYEMLVPTIKKNLKRRRSEFERTVKNVDKALEGLSPEQKVTAKSKGGIKKTVKKISDIIDAAEKKGLDMTEKKAKGGRVGLKLGTKKKSNIDKIKKTFGTLSVRAGIDKNPNPTYADKIAGAKMKKKNKKKII
jgi:sugar-specific transcriptional regulator TrmB